MRMKIADIDTNGRFRKDLGDTEALAKSIEKHGLLHLPVVTTDGRLVCGYRRLDAVWKLGWTEVDVRVIDPDSLIEAENDENEVRKAFTPSERVAIAKAIEARIGERRGRPNKSDKEKRQNIDGFHAGQRTKDLAAKKAGFGNQETYRQATKVVEEGTPELSQAMDSGGVSISAAATVAELPKEEQAATVAKGPEAVKEKAAEIRKSKVNGQLVADPPDIAELRAAGKIAADAVVEITEPEQSADQQQAEAVLEAESDEAKLTDEEWLASLPLRSKLDGSCLRAFEMDALYYRVLSPIRKKFQHHASRVPNAARQRGHYAYRTKRWLKTDHPKHWLLCPEMENGGCGGSGQVPLIGDCPKCRGKGYWIK